VSNNTYKKIPFSFIDVQSGSIALKDGGRSGLSNQTKSIEKKRRGERDIGRNKWNVEETG
jgi:hypothetical protein